MIFRLGGIERGLDVLTRDPDVLNRRIGRPAATKRDMIDSSYDDRALTKDEGGGNPTPQK